MKARKKERNIPQDKRRKVYYAIATDANEAATDLSCLTHWTLLVVSLASRIPSSSRSPLSPLA